MSISTDIETKLRNNHRTIFITDADDLLAAWQFKRKGSSKRSKNLSMVSTKWRYSAPPNEKSPLMPYHISYRSNSGKSFSKVKPAFEYSTRSCHHTHGRNVKISVPDLSALEAVDFAKRNVAPYVSPIIDTHTLALVCKDLGLTGKAVPKVINGRQYIAFVETTGSRSIFPSTFYSANNRKIINMAIGSLGIKNMVKTGAKITIYLAVGLTILEAFLSDHNCIYDFFGNLGSDLIKIGISSVMGAIFGIAMGGVITVASVPIAAAILISVITGAGLNTLDDHYQLTVKLIAVLEKMGDQLGKAVDYAANETQSVMYQGFWNFLRSSGLRFYKPF
jgi:hypothetical protein